MKPLILIFAFFLLSFDTFAQSSNIDSLIQHLDNSQIGFDGDYAGAKINLKGEPSISLYDIGKPATQKLVAVLEDAQKGIIAHIILSWIWQKTNRPQTILIEKEKIVVYIYNGLTFFEKKNEIFSNEYDLKVNKLLWEAFLQKNIP